MKIQNLKIKYLFLAAAMFGCLAITAAAQTPVFTYQGRFTDSTVAQPTNGVYNMSFKLFDAAAGGTQVGAIVNIPAVSVVNGIFTVQLDYTAAGFDGTARFLEITVTNVVLSPRQEITSAPHAIAARTAVRANDSNKLGGIDADQYVTGQVVRSVNNLTNNVTLAAGSNITITPTGSTLTIASTGGGGSGINNQTSLQTAANFNVDGTGAANVFNAATQYNIGGVRVLSVGGGNVFAGGNAGTANTTGIDNAFVGTNAGLSNLSGINNSFFGTDAGRTNTGSDNSFFGRSSGFANTTGVSNSFFGEDAGRFNLTGGNNAFFGISAGQANTTGGDNSFVGARAGRDNTIGGNNSFFGTDAGRSNTAGDNAFFGRSAGFANTTGTRNVFFGLDAGRFNLSGSANSFIGTSAGSNNTIGANNTAVGDFANFGGNGLSFATALGSGAIASSNNTVVLGRTADTVVAPNLLQVGTLGAPGATSLCRNALNQISVCAAGGGSGSFIDNSTVQQPTSNFNISGGGTAGGTLSANIVNSATTYRIGGVNVFATPNQTSVVAGQLSNYTLAGSNSAFFGFKAGQSANGFSQANTFIGSEAGELTTSGGNNTFVGKDAGFFNISGSVNSFFGSSAGKSNTTANGNSFFGYESGLINSTGTRNAFFGFQAGRASATVNDNSFFGYQAGTVTTGGNNSFFGSLAGSANTTGGYNSFFGNSAGINNTTGSENTFIGDNAGNNNSSGSKNTIIGSSSLLAGSNNIAIGNETTTIGSNNTVIGFQSFINAGATNSTVIGAGVGTNKSNTIVLGGNSDTVEVSNLLSAKNVTVDLTLNAGSVLGNFGKFSELRLGNTFLGHTPVCIDAVKRVGVCPAPLSGKLEIGATSLANAFEKQNAELETQAAQIKQQNAQIAVQAEQIKIQQMNLEALKQTVCAMNPAARICGNQ